MNEFMWSEIQEAVVVAGHAPFKAAIREAPAHPERDDAWVLQSFQAGEPALYLEHIRRGVALWAARPAALLIFSGGYTREEAGVRWSEAATYAAIARRFDWWKDETGDPPLEARTALEDFSRDSFENLLFSLCRFQQVVGRYPRRLTLVSWAFKQARFDRHRAALRFPAGRFCFEGANDPLDMPAALRGEADTLRAFQENRYGSAGPLAEKRSRRNPFHRQHPFASCPAMGDFFSFIDHPENARSEYPGRLPWED